MVTMREVFDGYMNVVTGLGGAKDPTAYTRHTARRRLQDTVLESLYVEDHFAAKVVEAMPAAAIRAGWALSVPGDPDRATALARGYANKEERLEVRAEMSKGARWGRLFGGAITWIGADDGSDPSRPLDEDRIGSVRFLHTFDRRRVTIERYYSDPRSGRYREPMLYRVRSAPLTGVAGAIDRGRRTLGIESHGALVHESRVVRWPGQPTTDDRRRTLQGWDDSVLERAWDALKETADDYGAKTQLLARISQPILKVKDFWALIAGNKKDVLADRVALMDRARSRARTIPIDTEEDYVNVTQPVAGVRDLVREGVVRLSSAAGMPASVLLGQAITGLGADPEGDLVLWDALVEEWRQLVLRERHERIAELILRAADGPSAGAEPERWSIAYRELRLMTRTKRAEVGKLEAETDALNIDRGVYSPEVAAFRHTSDGAAGEVVLDEEELAARRKRRKELASLPPKDNSELGTIGPRTSAVLDVVRGYRSGDWSRETAVGVLVEIHRHTEEQAERILGPEDFDKPGAEDEPEPPPNAPPPPSLDAPGPEPDPKMGEAAGAPRGLPGVNDGGAREPGA